MASKKRGQRNSLELIRSGDKKALDLVTPPLIKFITSRLKHAGCFSMELRDTIFDDTIYDLIRKKGTVPELIDPIPYLIGMAKIIIKRYIDKDKDELWLIESFQENYNPNIKSEEEQEDYTKSMESIKTLSIQLPKAYREIIENYWLKGKSADEICKERNYDSLKNFSSMKSRALNGLRKKIIESDNHHELKFWLRRNKKNDKNDDNK